MGAIVTHAESHKNRLFRSRAISLAEREKTSERPEIEDFPGFANFRLLTGEIASRRHRFQRFSKGVREQRLDRRGAKGV